MGERVRCMEAIESGGSLSCLARKSAEESGDIGGREWTYVATYRRMGEWLFWFIYSIPLSYH